MSADTASDIIALIIVSPLIVSGLVMVIVLAADCRRVRYMRKRGDQ
jgi:nitrate reductase gamma subunit